MALRNENGRIGMVLNLTDIREIGMAHSPWPVLIGLENMAIISK